MDFFIFFTIFSYIFLVTKAHKPNNNPSSITNDLVLPRFQYPVAINDGLSPQCSRPGFELFRRENKIFINFPTYGHDLIIKSISYDTRRLDLIDPKNCVHEVFLNLNLSCTPFSYYYVLKEYKYINCSSKLPTFVEVPCLSGLKHHVYVVAAWFSPPDWCTSVKTVAIPFSYSPYLSDNSFGLSLTWNLTRDFQDGEGIGCQSQTLHVLAPIAFIIFLVVALFYAKIALYKIFDFVKEKEKLGDTKIGKALGDYEALSPLHHETKFSHDDRV